MQPQELDRGINFCQISRKSPDTANYRSPCGLLAINNYQHLLSLESSSHFISLSEKLKYDLERGNLVFIYIYQNKYEQVYNVSVCRGTTYR